MTRIIGVTGGVGSGKSEILSFLQKNYNCSILKSDDAARDLEKKGQACYGPVVSILEENDRPLDETIALFEEGLKLVRSCDRKLKQFETKINDIIQKNEGDEDEL